MANKRTASMKPAKKSISDELTPEEYFNEAKQGLLAIADSYNRNAKRPDNVVAECSRLHDLGWDYGYVIHLPLTMVEAREVVYCEVANRLTHMTFEKITSDEWEDPFADMLEYVTEADLKFKQLMIKWAKFDAVRPFGEKIEQLRLQLLEMIDKEKMLDNIGEKPTF